MTGAASPGVAGAGALDAREVTGQQIAVAMSGGLDSSVAALLLSREGHQVVGLSMLLWDHSAERRNGRCCGALDLTDAKRVAHDVGFPHYTLRMDGDFRERVVDPFVRDYLEGRTPSPCVRCNTWVKFDVLMARAAELGIAHVATGHYARIVEGPDGPELHRGMDEQKDQSYFLFELSREALSRTWFPLGDFDKPSIREIAREAGLVVAEKSESMEVCFVPGSVRDFVEDQVASHPERYASETLGESARLVDRDGAELGLGAPYYRYTVGQRRGLGLGGQGGRLYVLDIDADRNRVTLGGAKDLLRSGLVGERTHWLLPEAPDEIDATVKIRSRHPGVESRITSRGDGSVDVEFSEPQAGVAPGQAAVFYRGTRVIGGCWIAAPGGCDVSR